MKTLIKVTLIVLCMLALQTGPAPVSPAYAAVNCDAANVVCKGGALSADETWTAGNVYVITEDLSVPNGVTLTLEAGVIVKFLYYSRDRERVDMLVRGTLNINGTANNKVYITSSRDDTVGGDTNDNGGDSSPAAQDWRGIQYQNGSNGSISYAELRYGGQNDSSYVLASAISMDNSSPTLNHVTLKNMSWTALYLNNSSPTLSNIRVEDCGWAAISALPTDQPTITNFTAHRTTLGGLEIRESLTGNATWNQTGIVYLLSSDFAIAQGATLNIEPGVIVKFRYVSNDRSRLDLLIRGTLNVNGTADNKVYFTSSRDDTLGGDTNGNSGNSSPAAEDWRGIQFQSGASGSLNYAELRYGGQNSSSDGLASAISMDNSSPTLNQVTIKDMSWNGIYLNNSSPTLSNITVQKCGLGRNQCVAYRQADHHQLYGPQHHPWRAGNAGIPCRRGNLGSDRNCVSAQ